MRIHGRMTCVEWLLMAAMTTPAGGGGACISKLIPPSSPRNLLARGFTDVQFRRLQPLEQPLYVPLYAPALAPPSGQVDFLAEHHRTLR